jgi:hypothetical protein
MAMVGLREVLIFAENGKRNVTVTVGNTVVSGKLLRVNPLIIEQAEGGVTVIDFEVIQSVRIEGASGEEILEACKPQKESKFMGTRKF